MKFFRNTIILLMILFSCSCAKKQIVSDVDYGKSPGGKLFAKAEKAFNEKIYDSALEHYNDYLALFPGEPLAPAALLKIGAIYSARTDYEKARTAYKKIIEAYPDSSFVSDGQVEILVTYYKEGLYEDVINQADMLKDENISNVSIIRKYAIVSDAYMDIGAQSDAVYSLITAHDKSNNLERQTVITKLKKTIRLLSSSTIISLLNNMEDNGIRGYLLYQLGRNNIAEDKYEDAIIALTEFISQFPEHEGAQNAKDLIEELNKQSTYNRFSIGCLLPLSGRYKVFGDRALKGIELAMQQFGSLGINPLVEIIIEDTGADPDMAMEGVKRLAQRNVAAIIGPIITAEAAAKQAQESNIPIITLTQKDNITEIGEYVFRNFLTPKMQIEAIVSYAFDELDLSRFAILYPEENYGITFMNMFWDEVLAYGGEIVGVESYDSAHTDFATPIKKLVGLYYEIPEDLKATNEPELVEDGLEMDFITDSEDVGDEDDVENLGDSEEFENGDFLEDIEEIESNKESEEEEEPQAIVDFHAVFIPEGAEKAGLILPQLVYYDVEDVYLFGTNLWHSERLIEMAKRHVQGAIMPEIFFSQSASWTVKNFVSTFENTFGEKPGFIEAVSYDTAMILFDIVSRPNIRFRSSIKEGLKSIGEFPSITGPTYFEENGEAHKKLYLLEISGRKFIELEQ